MRIVFMGTPDFAVATFKALVEQGSHQIVGAVTTPDRPAGRGLKLQTSAVKQYAESKNIPVLQPEKLRDPEFIAALTALNADLFIVVAFRILPEIVFNIPPKGTFNLHASLLPDYRGAAPINWAIMNGETTTGVTTFFLKKKVDTGNIILQEKMTIAPDETAGTLHDKLMELGAKVVLKTVSAIHDDQLTVIEQDDTVDPNPAPKIFKPDCELNCNQLTKDAYNFIRGLSPYPVAWTVLSDKTLRIFDAEIGTEANTLEVGKFTSDGKTFLHLGTKDGYLILKTIQLQGKKRMPIEDFLRGYNWTNN